MSDQTTTVAALRDLMRGFVAERDWQQFHSPKNLAMAAAVEAAELMEHFLWIDNDESRRLMQDPAKLTPVADEIADVVGVCLALCNALGLDLSEIFADKMARNATKYPNRPPVINRPAEKRMKGVAHRRSRLYKPGAMNAQTWYRTNGSATRNDASSVILSGTRNGEITFVAIRCEPAGS